MPRPVKRWQAVVVASTVAVLAGGVGAAVYAATSGTSTRVVSVTRVVATPVAQTSSSQLGVGQIYAKDGSGVVEIDATTAGTAQSSPFYPDGSPGAQVQGTGFVIDGNGDIVTNEHVVAGASSVNVKFADGSTYKATVVGADASTDVAVIKVAAPAGELHPLTLASSSVAVGDPVVAIGDPFGLDNTVTVGIVSAIAREIVSPNNTPIENAIQTDAAINHGNSGGPLLNLRGEVIGITSQIASSAGGNNGVGFALPSSTVKQVVTQLLANGKALHARLGVRVQTIPPNVASQLGVPAGVAVGAVQAGGPAAKAGLKSAAGSRTIGGQTYPTGGEVITAVNGTKMTTAQQLRGLIETKRPGAVIELTVVRHGTTRKVHVTLGAK
jgi:S1-C subfamily serine protease